MCFYLLFDEIFILIQIKTICINGILYIYKKEVTKNIISKIS